MKRAGYCIHYFRFSNSFIHLLIRTGTRLVMREFIREVFFIVSAAIGLIYIYAMFPLMSIRFVYQGF